MSGARPRLDIVTGAFGSGKTTLIRRLLASTPTLRAAVVLNDIVGLDLEVEALRRVAEPVVGVMGGCVCCERREAFRRALETILDHGDRVQMPDRILLECAGSARLEDVVDLVRRDVLTVNRLRLGTLVHTLDSQAALEGVDAATLEKIPREIDLVVLTKADLVAAESVQELEEKLGALAPGLRLLRLAGSEGVEPLARIWSGEPGEARQEAGARLRRTSGQPGAAPLAPAQGSDPGELPYEVVEATWCGETNWARLGVWLSLLFAVHGASIRRLKGEVCVGGRWMLLHAVGRTMYVPELLESRQGAGPNRVVIVLDRGATDRVRLAESLRDAAGGAPSEGAAPSSQPP